MQNYSKCSPRRLPIPTSDRARAGAVFALALVAKARSSQSPTGRRAHDQAASAAAAHFDRAIRIAGSPLYTIRVVTEAGTPCATCATCAAETGTGPVGHCGDDPVCDRCMLEQCEPLGMVLALVAVTRAYATTGTDEPGAARESLVELGAFARIFEHVVAKWGPPRLMTPDGHDGHG